MRALALVNILDVKRGDGTYVTSLEPALLLEALSFIVDFHKDATVLEFLQVRRILEPAATAMAAERITEDEITGLGELLDSLGKHPEVEDLVANDMSFTGGSRPAPGTRCSARCSRPCPRRPPGPGFGAG